MKVAHVLNRFSEKDGVSQVANNIVNALNKKSVSAVILCRSSLENAHGAAKIKKASFAQMLAIARKNKINILHSHFGLGALYAGIIAKILGIPHILTYHALAPSNLGTNQNFRLNKMFMTLLIKFKLADEFVAISNYSARELDEFYNIKTANIINNFVDTAKFAPNKKSGGNFRIKHNIGEDKIVVGCLALFDINKNQKFLIKLIQNMPKNTVLLLGGTGQLLNKCKQLAEELHIADKVIFTGFVGEEEKPAFYNACDIFAFPSLWEGWGLPVTEAMACGKPAVVFNKYGLPETVDARSGFVADDGSFAGFVRKLILDKGLRLKMGANARKRVVENFSAGKQVEKYIEVYSKHA